MPVRAQKATADKQRRERGGQKTPAAKGGGARDAEMEGTPPDAQMTEGRPPRAAARRYARPSRRKVLLSPPSGDDDEDAAGGEGHRQQKPRGKKARAFARCRCVACGSHY
jgi:hypothetical protein